MNSPAEALLGLAGLEEDCPEIRGAVAFPFCESHCACEHHKPWRCKVCGGTGKVPVLPGLREPCSCALAFTANLPDSLCRECRIRFEVGLTHLEKALPCLRCEGRGWLPKQGRDALHDAMHKDGWDINTKWSARGGRWVWFEKHQYQSPYLGDHYYASEVDDWLAAVKAMQVAGYK